jgi:predicted Zn finger-like uncharacterized protein
MSLITRCRHCHTTFRVTPEQLQVHGGQVRCGRCMQIFNALASLVPEMQTEPGQAAGPLPVIVSPPVASPAPGAEVTAPLIGSQEPVPVSAGTAQPMDAVLPAAAEALPAEPTREETVLAEAAQAETLRAGTQESAVSPDNPFVYHPAPAVRRNPRLVAACVLLVTALAAQGIYFYRGEIAARHPLARQWLTAACAEAGCTVLLPQDPKAIVIEASDLQTLDPLRPDRIQLTATLRNHAGHDVAYPALDLVLTNANDHTLARRIFLPAEYLGRGQDARAGFTANAELTVRLALETGDLGAAGFRLTLLAAPRL